MKRLLLFCSLSLLALSSACASSPAAPAAEPPGTQPAYPSYPSYPSEPVRPIQTYLPPAQPADRRTLCPLPQDARLQPGPAYLDDYELQTASTFPPEYAC